MGFRDLHTFNLAMLAKQGWRLLHNPDTLDARILKAKYFSRTNLLHAQVGNKPSYTWRSIFEGIAVLKMGCIWRVGNGTQIDVWHDPWIPNIAGFRVEGPNPQYAHIEKVSQVLLDGPRRWNEGLVHACFDVITAEAILQIPLAQIDMPDVTMWAFDNKGLYSVKEGYECAWSKMLQEVDDSEQQIKPSNLRVYKGLWKIIWKLETQPKTRSFCWRVARNILSTRTRLATKGVDVGNGCYLCDSSEETVFHLLFNCPYTADMLNMLGIVLPSVPEPADLWEWLNLLQSVFNSLQVDQRSLLAIGWSMIRNQRNEAWQGKSVCSLAELSANVANAQNDLCRAKGLEIIHNPLHVRPRNWRAPSGSMVKINTDAAIFADQREFGVGIVIINFEGTVLAAKFQKYPSDIDAQRAETIAAKEGLLLAWELGLTSVTLEGGAKEVFSNFGVWNQDFSHTDLIMHDAIHISSWFSFFKACYVPRQCNAVADHLAALARYSDSGLLIGECPNCIEDLVSLDLSSD